MAGKEKPLMDIKLVVAGSFGFKDIGDESMLTEDLHYIRSDLGIADSNIFLFGDDPHYVSTYHGHPIENCLSSRRLQDHVAALQLRGQFLKSARKVLGSLARGHGFSRRDRRIERIFAQADAALITGGGTINTRDAAGYSLKRMHDMVLGFKAYGLPLFISGQTIGPLGEYPHHDEMAARIVQSADMLTVRDSLYSRRYLSMIGTLRADLLETFDDAYTLEFADATLPPETADFLSQEPRPVAVNVTEYTSEKGEQRAFIARLCDWLTQEDGARVILLSHTPHDQVRLYQIFDMCKAESKSLLHIPDTRKWSGAQLKKTISKCAVAIGGRYHFIVFAGTSNTPFVGMCGNHYSYLKQNGFADPLGLSRMILNERETWEFDTLISRYKDAKQMRLDLSDRFERPSESMAAFGKWLTEDALPCKRRT